MPWVMRFLQPRHESEAYLRLRATLLGIGGLVFRHK